jgi:hypothetical protein
MALFNEVMTFWFTLYGGHRRQALSVMKFCRSLRLCLSKAARESSWELNQSLSFMGYERTSSVR